MSKGDLNIVSTFGDFSFWINLKEQSVYEAEDALRHLGYRAKEEVSLDDWNKQILHRSERKTVKSIITSFSQLRRKNISLDNYQLELLHRMRKADGSYAQILRVCRLVETEGQELRQYNLCFDITSMPRTNVVSFDVKSLVDDESKLDEIGKAIKDEIPTKSLFTERELEVLNTWARESSLETLANLLNITVRTAETHLKNMRKKVGVSRTVDVLEFARRAKML